MFVSLNSWTDTSFLKVLPDKGTGDKDPNHKCARVVIVPTVFHWRTWAGDHDVLLQVLVVVGDQIITYKRLVLPLGRPNISARGMSLPPGRRVLTI